MVKQFGEKCIGDASLFQLTHLNEERGVPLHHIINAMVENQSLPPHEGLIRRHLPHSPWHLSSTPCECPGIPHFLMTPPFNLKCVFATYWIKSNKYKKRLWELFSMQFKAATASSPVPVPVPGCPALARGDWIQRVLGARSVLARTQCADEMG